MSARVQEDQQAHKVPRVILAPLDPKDLRASRGQLVGSGRRAPLALLD